MGGGCLPPKSKWCPVHVSEQSATKIWFDSSLSLYIFQLLIQSSGVYSRSRRDIQLFESIPKVEPPLVLNYYAGLAYVWPETYFTEGPLPMVIISFIYATSGICSPTRSSYAYIPRMIGFQLCGLGENH